MVGSVWGLDVGRVWRVTSKLDEWKHETGVTGEFKFAELSKGKKLERAQAFVKKAVEHSALIGLKACVLDTEAASGLNAERGRAPLPAVLRARDGRGGPRDRLRAGGAPAPSSTS